MYVTCGRTGDIALLVLYPHIDGDDWLTVRPEEGTITTHRIGSYVGPQLL